MGRSSRATAAGRESLLKRGEAEMFWRFAKNVRRYLKTTLTSEQCARIVADATAARADNFLLLLRRGIYDNPRSPYRKLLEHAGASYGDIAADVRANGVEAAAARLFRSGVYVDFEEFKGTKPIERPGFRLEARAEDFDNPLLTRDFEVLSGGSGGAPRRMGVDLELLVLESAARRLFLEGAGVHDRPRAIWRAVPPGAAGLKHALRAAKTGRPLDRWFSPTKVKWSGGMWPSAVFLGTARIAGQLAGRAIPRPEHVPLMQPAPIARWIQQHSRKGQPPLLAMPSSPAVRLARAGFDLDGAVFELGGESITRAKAEAIRACGASNINCYSMSEAGTLGVGCLNRQAFDDVHLIAPKVAVNQRKVKTIDGSEVDALLVTTLHPSSPKILLNVDIGDYAVMPTGGCGCAMERLGFAQRLHTIGSYEKLTAGGMQFIGSDVLAVLEEILPARHGGGPGDYQFIEEERDGLSRIAVAVSPELALRDEAGVTATILDFLSAGSRGGRMMADQWRQTGTLRVLRQRPFVTETGKTPPIRVMPR